MQNGEQAVKSLFALQTPRGSFEQLTEILENLIHARMLSYPNHYADSRYCVHGSRTR